MNRLPAFRALRTALLLWLVLAPVRGEQFGNFYYMVNGGTVAITGTAENTSGAITIPAMIGGRPVTSIAGFMNRRGVTSVSIPEGVTTIDSGAFRSCIGLTSITIPESVTSIGASAFLGCTGLNTISISERVTSIGVEAFSQCTNLTAIGVSPLNPNYSSLDGVLFNQNRTTLVQFPRGKAGPYAIPGSVTSVGEAAFRYSGGLTSISIPGSVTDLGRSAFSGCAGLTSVSIPASASSIGASAFSGCTSLTSVSIAAGVTTIGDGAFSGCTSLTSASIPASVTTIGDGAFSRCTNLTAIEVDPGNPSYSGVDGALLDKNRTTLIHFPTARTGAWSIPEGVTEIPNNAFSGCTGLTSVAIPGTVTAIHHTAFYGCVSLTSVSIPDSVTTIGDSVFSACTGLTSVTIPNSVTALRNAFVGCTGLTSVSIPNSVIDLSGAFAGCAGLTSVAIPDSVTDLSSAFYGCTGLTSIAIPDSITAIGDSAFAGCTSLTSVSIPDNVTYLGHYAFTDCTSLASVTIGGGVTLIGWNAFEGCTSLTSVAIPDSVTMVGDRAFSGCTSLASVSIGSGVTEIGWWAFLGCTALSSVTIPPNVTTMAVEPFSGCTGLTAIEVSPQNPNFSSLDGVLFNKAHTRLIQFPSQRSGTYSVPGTVLEIYGLAFQNCAALTSVSVPDSVTSVIPASFLDCPVLTRIDVDTANPAYSSLDGVLFNKNRTTLIRYPTGLAGACAIPAGVTLINDLAFLGCTGLTSVSMPGSVATIGHRAFEDCTGLTSVSFSNSVTSIGSYAFENCTRLTSVSIPNSVTWIDYAAFRRCTGLTSVTIGRGVTLIEIKAFSGCTGLIGFTVDALNPKYRSIDGVLFSKTPFSLLKVPARNAGHYSIPNGVNKVGYLEEAFEDCAGLTSVFIPASITAIDPHVGFQSCSSLTAIEVDPMNQNFQSLDGVLYNKYRTILIRVPAGRTGTCTVPESVLNFEYGSFAGCIGLDSLLCLGDNPSPDATIFADTAPGFTFYYLRGSFGFTSPTWQGYPAVMIDRAVHPATEWLLGHGLPYDADLQDDPNSDGVSLLMAYALNLDPNLNLRASLPVPLLGAQDLSLSFHGVRPDITYAAETSTNLVNWTTAGVILSAPGPDGQRTASIARDAPVRYLRLVLRQ